jgi:hypothetical protein
MNHYPKSIRKMQIIPTKVLESGFDKRKISICLSSKRQVGLAKFLTCVQKRPEADGQQARGPDNRFFSTEKGKVPRQSSLCLGEFVPTSILFFSERKARKKTDLHITECQDKGTATMTASLENVMVRFVKSIQGRM